MKELSNEATYTIKLTRRDIIRLCVLITAVSEDDMGEGFDRVGHLKIRDELRKQYHAEDEKRGCCEG